MSYILDALRRADAERQRGQVPGLHAPTAAGGAPPEAVARQGPLWAGAAVLAVLLAAAAWWGLRAPAAAPTAGEPASTSRPAPAAPVAAAPATTAPPAPNLPQVVSAVPPAPAAPTSAAAPAAVQPAAVAVAAVAADGAPRRAPPAAAAARPPEPPPVKLADLPAELRRELPPLTIGGSIWSDSPSNRFVIVNGQVVREGEAAAAGVLLERIGPKSVLLRWRDQRIEVPL